MALLGQVQELYVDLRGRNTVDYALGDVSKVEGEVLRDEESLLVRWSVVEMTGNGMVCEDVGVMFVTSVIECGCDFDPEGEDAADYLNRRDRDRGPAGCGGIFVSR